jgi:hypothetical protein
MQDMNLMEALHTLMEQPTAVGIRSQIDGWSYVIKRAGEEGFALHRSKIGSAQPAEDLTFADEGELLAWWTTKREANDAG